MTTENSIGVANQQGPTSVQVDTVTITPQLGTTVAAVAFTSQGL